MHSTTTNARRRSVRSCGLPAVLILVAAIGPGRVLAGPESAGSSIDPTGVKLELQSFEESAVAGQETRIEVELSTSFSVSAIVLVTLADGSVQQLYPPSPGEIAPLPEGQSSIVVPFELHRSLRSPGVRVLAFVTIDPVDLPFILGARPEVGHIYYPNRLRDFGDRRPAEELFDWLEQQVQLSHRWTTVEAKWLPAREQFATR